MNRGTVETQALIGLRVVAPREIIAAVMRRSDAISVSFRGSSAGPMTPVAAGNWRWSFWTVYMPPDAAEQVIGWLREHGVEAT